MMYELATEYSTRYFNNLTAAKCNAPPYAGWQIWKVDPDTKERLKLEYDSKWGAIS
jgi:hypothetical protein